MVVMEKYVSTGSFFLTAIHLFMPILHHPSFRQKLYRQIQKAGNMSIVAGR
jgi:hypothetical protein